MAHLDVKYYMWIGNSISCWLGSEITHGKIQLLVEVENCSLWRKSYSSLYFCPLIPFKESHTYIWNKNIFSCRELIVCQGCRGEFQTDGKLAMIGGLTTNHLIAWIGDLVCFFELPSSLVGTCRISLGSHHHWQIQDFQDKSDILKGGGGGVRQTYYVVKFIQKPRLWTFVFS